jgi:AcrR family transcriptional regulator
MRAIARAVGMGPASLYTYFESLDDVYTTLLLSSYGRLAEATASAVSAFATAPPEDRVLVGILAYRRWALAHPNEFNLIFSDQIPGYAAPPGGPTIAAQVAVFQPILDAFAELRDEAEPLRLHRSALVWAAFHGAVALEVNNHLDWVDDTAALYEAATRAALAAADIPAPSPTVRRRFDRRAAGT